MYINILYIYEFKLSLYYVGAATKYYLQASPKSMYIYRHWTLCVSVIVRRWNTLYIYCATSSITTIYNNSYKKIENLEENKLRLAQFFVYIFFFFCTQIIYATMYNTWEYIYHFFFFKQILVIDIFFQLQTCLNIYDWINFWKEKCYKILN